ncbi:MAG: glycine--tRNA ligase subunit alpha [Planctomycetes bacterium]|nr:glycine--tRNA ligase subunit alpha [Planctomycetota bacterium]
MNFQNVILELSKYWSDYGCVLWQGWDLEMGAGTFNPATFLRVLGPEPWMTAYVEPSRRPKDGRYGENPNRLCRYYQFQVLIKPAPRDSQDIYIESLRSLGIDLVKHDLRFVEDDWEQPSIGASGLGWEVWLDGMEVTQFTYFQKTAGQVLDPPSLEITYGLERIAMFITGAKSVFDLNWTDDVSYGQIHRDDERQFSTFNFEIANTDDCAAQFESYERQCRACIERGMPIPAYDFVMKASHVFNLLDARGAIGVAQRATYIGRIAGLARDVAETYVKHREALGFPLLKKNSKQAV